MIILLGGRTGRDGMRRRHRLLQGAQRGIARNLRRRGAEGQRRRWSASCSVCSATAMSRRLIKRCNDFGAGGVSVAIGELADGLDIDLNAVPKKYEGLDGTELAISESPGAHGRGGGRRRTWTHFIAYAAKENLEATVVATVTDKNRAGDDLERRQRSWTCPASSSTSNGAAKHADACMSRAQQTCAAPRSGEDDPTGRGCMNGSSPTSNVCLQQGPGPSASTATIGARHRAHALRRQASAAPRRRPWSPRSRCWTARPTTASAMAWGFNPYITCPAEPVHRRLPVPWSSRWPSWSQPAASIRRPT